MTLLEGSLALGTNSDCLELVQITDPHLMADPNGDLLGMKTLDSLRRVLSRMSEYSTPDAVLVTGDIAADGDAEAYDYLEALLPPTMVSAWLPGNHDDRGKISPELKNRFSRTMISSHWIILMLDTQSPGQVEGYLSHFELDQLSHTIEQANNDGKHLLVATHHPLQPVGSAWLDEQHVGNGTEVLSRLQQCQGSTLVISGHVHQATDREVNGIRLLTTPSTCIQFAPHSENFGLDEIDPGMRRLALHANGGIETEVIRISCAENRPDFTSRGYH
jgi:Icc protein